MRTPYGPLLIGLLATASAAAQEPVAMRVKAPALTGIGDWVNGKPFALADKKGEVVVLHFFAFG